VRIGEALAQARGWAGLTVAEVSQRTRIKETIIRGIEGGTIRRVVATFTPGGTSVPSPRPSGPIPGR